jgi:bifunctional enzyme CysN/CysC
LEIELYRNSLRTYIIDGDNVREGLNSDLEFTEADRIENLRRATEVAKLMMDAGLIVIAAFISPFKRERERIKKSIGEANFIEVFVSTPLEVCEQRDAKGLYKKARDGKILNMTGISSPYEVPDFPNFTVNTHKPTDRFVQELANFIINLTRLKA